MNQKILLFQINIKKERAIAAVAKPLGIQVISVPKAKFTKTLGALAGIPGIKPASSPICPSVKPGASDTITSEMLVFSGITEKIMDSFLDAYKNAGIAPIELKAVITMYNIFWTPVALFSELSRERRRIAKGLPD